ncbi:hypothetical protein D3C81_2155860 [compost metagenome]
MHPVFCLIKNDAGCRFKYLIRHFHSAVQTVLFGHLLTQRRLVVMERWQAVQELHLRVAGKRQHLFIHLVVTQQPDTFGPF